ncbi:MAG TPA: hypothetical protein VIK18_27000, partial [Pirellulales bacterium]
MELGAVVAVGYAAVGKLESSMSQAATPMPSFAHPPVVETVLGVFFQPPEQFTIVRRSQFWGAELEQAFPNVEERPPIDEV